MEPFSAAKADHSSGTIGSSARQGRYDDLVLPQVPVLLRVAMTITGQPADAEDLVQDTLLRAWRAMGTFDGRHPRAWLLTILRHTEINRHRRWRPGLLDDPTQDNGRRLAAVSPSAEQQVLDRAFDGRRGRPAGAVRRAPWGRDAHRRRPAQLCRGRRRTGRAAGHRDQPAAPGP